MENEYLALCAENDRINEKWAEEKETFVGIISDLEAQIKELQKAKKVFGDAYFANLKRRKWDCSERVRLRQVAELYKKKFMALDNLTLKEGL